MLERWEHKVTIANDGKEALSAFNCDRFDLILMDVQMPEMNGFEATAAIRRQEAETGGHVPIIAMTANAMQGDRERCVEAGMDDYLSKPIQAEQLNELIKGLNERNAAANEPSPQPANETVANHTNLGSTMIFDRDLALQRLRGSEQTLVDVAQTFFDQGPRLMNDMHGAAAHEDFDTLERSAHTLKGSAGVLAANEVARLAQQVETNARHKHLSRSRRDLRRAGQGGACVSCRSAGVRESLRTEIRNSRAGSFALSGSSKGQYDAQTKQDPCS